ncbi:MAG: DNA polymerase III subunit beta [Coriobacteriia bacterium]|nr:DNA polymerase III subunit beta [Coriobacteriia bacterium]
MKLSIARSELVEALSIVSKGMSSRSTLPILSGIYFSADDGLLTLQSTDLEVSVKHSIPALTDDGGQVVIPGRLLTDIVRSLPEAAVTLETEGDHVLVRCQQSAFTVKTLNSSDFPKFPEVAVSESFKLPSSVLSSMVRKVAKAVSRDETRAVLTGVLMVIDGPMIKMVATDSYRLAMDEVILEESAGAQIEVVVPGRALDEATKIAAGSSDVIVGVSDNQVVFESGETTFVARRIEGTFPNYKQLVPERSDDDTVITIATDELAAAVKRVSLLALHNAPLRVSVSVEDQTLSLSATTQDVGDASEDLMVKVEGKDVEIAFNHSFMTDGLASVSTDTVSLLIQSAMKPGLLRSSEGEDFRYLLMPVRLG